MEPPPAAIIETSGSKNGQPLGPIFLDQGFSWSRDQHALIAEGNWEQKVHLHDSTKTWPVRFLLEFWFD
jgi:hypothetical protein